ncbi:MAG: 16S rRNA (cytosine(1402)-N(4))-methyltransferase RsmH [Nocardioides sp.]
MPAPLHVPVLLDRVVALLAPALERDEDRTAGRERVLVDCTLGLGGHSEAVLVRLPHSRVVGIDRDPQALALAGERLAPFGDRFTGVHAVYDEIPDVLEELGLPEVDAVLFDLGVSSMQLDRRERGFAYAEDAPLDMRMDGSTGPTAADVLNTYSVGELTRVLRDYGEEKFARKIAQAVVRRRESEPFTTSGPLVELLYAEIPAPARRTGGHPAKRTFQALRMEVNDELAVLRRALPAAIDAIGVGGRVVVESYHSLEDRLVKQAFTAATRSEVPPDLPFVPEGSEPALRLVTRGSEQADAAEIAENPRAASVRLRAVERVRPAERPTGRPTSRSSSKAGKATSTSTSRSTNRGVA